MSDHTADFLSSKAVATKSNVKNEIENDEKGFFISNEKDSIHIEIYMKDNENTYKMEIIHNHYFFLLLPTPY